ncbi:PREDICTED: uncharacterized protein LOC104733699 [Camelina sativa]|uniref:Uncharacterized protein LOC104733699 n=1 Tax=Camelina sativa TaxID=90675 RepID=A0ABM0V6D8_CAMSA|nr:PREDICTED: uncharacterized protein LOC104733699 [Camelina sativa]
MEDEMRKKEDETAEKEVTTTTRNTLVVDEYTPDEIMSLVESSSSSSPTTTMTTTEIEGANFSGEGGFRVRFIDDPYAVPLVVQSSSGYITINVNEESCGPSFSDSDASAMASVDASGLYCFEYGGEKEGGGAWSTNEVSASESCEWNDDLLARFLGEDEEDCV